MTVHYSDPAGFSEPLDHARMLHSRNWIVGTPTASSVDADFFAGAPNNSLTYERWKPVSLPAYWQLDALSDVSIGACAIGAHTLGTTGSTIAVEYWDDVDDEWVVVASVSPPDDSPVLFLFPEVDAQIWRVYVTGPIAPVLGVVKFGVPLVFPHPIFAPHAPLRFGRATDLRSNYSETGETLGRTRQRTQLVASYEWRTLRYAWVDQNWGVVQRAIEEEPFFFAWRPEFSGDVALGQVDRVPVPQFTGQADLMSVSMAVRAHGFD